MMNVHVLSNPFKATSSMYDEFDPLSTSVYDYIDKLKHKYKFIHYGLSGSQVDCEHYSLPYNRFNEEASRIIQDLKTPNDVVLCFFGEDNKGALTDHQDLRIVEPTIGYSPYSIFAPYRVFKSYSLMHSYYAINQKMEIPFWFDNVIPYGENPNNFKFKSEKQDYFLFLNRVLPENGLHLAIQLASHLKFKLIISGLGHPGIYGYDNLPDNVEFVGYSNQEQRKELISNAKAIICPNEHADPFVNLIVESYFSGTPIISTDWGSFTETVVQGVTGFRCRDFRDFVNAINRVDTIDPNNCYKFAIENYSHDVVYKKHDEYLEKIISLNFYR
jgi:glycosyltransferase involved in cell wall biosynthesis